MTEMRKQAPHQSAGGLDVQAPHVILALLRSINTPTSNSLIRVTVA